MRVNDINTEPRDNIEKENFETDQKNLISWVKANRKQLILIGVSVPAIIAFIYGVKNKDAMKTIWDNLNKELKKVELYSSKWFENASDEMLNAERERIRIRYCSSGNNYSEADRCYKLLGLFDNEISRRAWGDEIPHAPSIHREHGWYLRNKE